MKPCKIRCLQVTVPCAGACGKTSRDELTPHYVHCLWFCKDCRVMQLKPERVMQLPSELWVNIFQHLSMRQLLKARLVCNSWLQIVNGSSTLRSKLLVRFPKQFIMDRDYSPSNLLPASNARFDGVQIATVGSWWAKFGTDLVQIEMVACDILLPNMLKLLKQTRNLKILVLSDLMLDSSEERLPADFRLDKMESLSITEITAIENLEVLLELCPNLKVLTINVDDYDSPYWYGNFLLKVLKFLENLRSTLEQLNIRITEDTFKRLVQMGLPKLKSLSLTGDKFQSNRALVNFCRKHPALEALDILEVSSGNEMIVPEIVSLLPNLTRLKIRVHSDPPDQPILKYTTKLRQLSLVGDCLTNPPAVDFDNECPNLTELHLDSLTFEYEDSLRRFTAISPNLRVLSIVRCTLESWSIILRAIRSLKQLRRLTVQFLTVKWAGRCCVDYLDNLTRLELAESPVPPETMIALLTMCPRLTELTMSRLEDAIDGTVLDAMCRKLRHLEVLKVERCGLSLKDKVRLEVNLRSVQELSISARK